MPSTKAFIGGESHYADCRFEKEHISFSSRGRTVLTEFTAVDCDIVVEKGVSLIIVAAEFRQCRIDSRSSKPTNAQTASFEDCVFTGSLQSWQFGGRVGGMSLVGCTFEKALLNDCEFSECDVRALRFGGWPTIVLLNPVENRERILRAPWPRTAKAQIYATTLVQQGRFACDGFALDAEKAAKWMEADPESLRLTAEDLGDIAIF